MISISDKTKCCGCTACKNICPQQCINMEPDFEGFLYPKVEKEKCIRCNACVKVCPVLNYELEDERKMEAYALRTKNEEDLKISTSGGFTTPLAFWVFKKGGKLWAASYDEHWKVCHVELDSIDSEFAKTRGSKYVQSDLGDSFSKIQDELVNGELVCFIGTTCQVYGLKSYLKKDYPNLVTVDLVCHGTPSPKLWKKYIDFQEKQHGAILRVVNFRNKTYGYHSGTMMLQFDNGKRYVGSARVDLMLKSFFSEIASRPSCYSCVFKNKFRKSDFTIFDCWHMSDLVLGRQDDDKGYTNVLIQSEKGKQIFEQIRHQYVVYAVDADKAIRLDGIMIERSAKPHIRRNEFYELLQNMPIEEAIRIVFPVRKKDYLIEKSKRFLFKTKLIKIVKKMRRSGEVRIIADKQETFSKRGE